RGVVEEDRSGGPADRGLDRSAIGRRAMTRLFIGVLLMAAAQMVSAPAEAHKPSDSYLSLSIGASVTGEWKIALRDLDFAIGLDGNDDGAITWGELHERHPAIAAYALSRLHIEGDGVACPTRLRAQLVDSLTDGAYTVLRFAVDCKRAPQSLQVDYSLFFDIDRQHRGLLRLDAGGASQTAVFSPDRPQQTFDLAGASPLHQ